MHRKTFIVAKFYEIQALVAVWLGKPDYDTLRLDMLDKDFESVIEGVHEYTVAPESEWINHDRFVSEVRAKGKIEWNWELLAVMEELARDGKIEFGDYLIELYEGDGDDPDR